jgi:hypothetical protein
VGEAFPESCPNASLHSEGSSEEQKFIHISSTFFVSFLGSHCIISFIDTYVYN